MILAAWDVQTLSVDVGVSGETLTGGIGNAEDLVDGATLAYVVVED